MAYQMDFFAGIESKVLAAIEVSKVQYPAYVFVRDEEESATGRLAFVDQNNVLKFIRGENKKQILNVDALPDASEGDVEVLYIYEDIVYVFDGTEYKPMYKDHTAELEALTKRVDALETSSKDVVSKVSNLETNVETLKTGNADVAAQLKTVTEQVTKFEDRIIEVEKVTLTFVELE